MKRVLLRNIPDLAQELDPVINAFDPWARGSWSVLQPVLEASAWSKKDDSFQGKDLPDPSCK
jgi:hypothetical protein